MNRFRFPVTIIRLVDPPLHEFLPSIEDDAITSSLADQLEITKCKLVHKVKSCEETELMLGFRGCKLGIKINRPEIIEMRE